MWLCLKMGYFNILWSMNVCLYFPNLHCHVVGVKIMLNLHFQTNACLFLVSLSSKCSLQNDRFRHPLHVALWVQQDLHMLKPFEALCEGDQN